MVSIYERFFKIRHYECDSSGYLHKAGYFRYMQETAYEAAESVGFGMVHHTNTGKAWFVRHSDLDFFQQLRYGDSVIVRTWVEDFRRVRSIRLYEIRKIEDNNLAAKGWTDWIYLDRQTGQPVTIPDEIVQAFYPGWNSNHHIRRNKFIEPHQTGIGFFQTKRIVVNSDLDPAQHVNNAVYVSYLDDCLTDTLNNAGWSHKKINNNGWTIKDLTIQIEFSHPLFLQDEIEIQTWIPEFTKYNWNRFFLIKKQPGDMTVSRALIKQGITKINQTIPVEIPSGFLGKNKVDQI